MTILNYTFVKFYNKKIEKQYIDSLILYQN